ncbi:MAG: chromosome segregation protein SMC [Planctomycetota bacterium]|jgi:chromosome segregation protein
MFLKRITLSGFKSFADKVDFDFDRGVTCIVGPNGCGKSNVLDSFKWVLGEQSARSLRGKQMVDMIFNGSSTRKSSSVAQVDLIFGNEDRTLPVDRDEIVVTRKLYRSGESEYLLNNESSRLKDVRELFMDTGVGVDAYSVIEQGRVDALLQSSPTERRLIFEEAAGISKYKARKREAQRKLERTEQNLLRVEDIIEELERRLRSVKLQAGKARNFKEYESRLNDLRSTFVMAEYHRLIESHQRECTEVQTLTDRITGIRTDINRMDAEDAESKVKIDAMDAEIGMADNRLVQARSDLGALEERIESAGQRIEEQQTLAERTRERVASDESRLAAGREELGQLEDKTTSFEEETTRLHGKISELHEHDSSIAREIAAVQAEMEEEKSAILDVLRRSGQAHNEVVRLNSHRESLISQKGRLSERDAQIGVEIQSHVESQSALESELSETDKRLQALEQDLAQCKSRSAEIDGVRQDLVDRVAMTKERRSALQSRSDLLDDLQRKMEGVGEGVRQFLAADNDLIPEDGEVAPEASVLLAGLVDADIAYAHVIEAALGDRDQCIVLDERATMLRHLAHQPELAGRISFLCLDSLPPILNERDFSEEDGFVARVADLVRLPPRFERLYVYLFAKTVLVRDLDAALALAARDVTGHRFVTMAGEVVEPDGRVIVGPLNTVTHLISRRSELRDIASRLGEMDKSLALLEDELGRTKAEASDLEQTQQALRTRVYETNTAKVEINANLGKVVESIERLSGEQPLLAGEIAMIDRQVEEVLAKTSESNQLAEKLERENESREACAAELQARIDAAVITRQQNSQELTEAKVAAGQMAEKRAAAAQSVTNLRRTISELETSLSSAEHDLAQCRLRIDEARATITAGRDETRTLESSIAEYDAEAARLRRLRDQLRLEAEKRSQAMREARANLEKNEGDCHQREMAAAEINIRLEELTSRVAEELNVDLAAKYEEYEYEEQDWAQVEAEIDELRGKMTRLGNVNLGAIDELAELEERFGFLTSQRDDLTDSRRQLEQLIERLDNESKERFSSAFGLIRDNFRTLFRKLFGGGRADVVLEDTENVLESGIEIVAQPPGKELQIISLMSGGEKSLTAIALLMSIFKCRPAPFVILDEVDAALDEANNERFNRIVNEFVDQSQFIIISHSKRTMSIAEQLYGVTMQEPGVSTRVAVQLNDANVA